MERFSTTKEDLPSYTLIVIPSLGQELEIRALKNKKESSNRIQYKNPVKESSKRMKKVNPVRVQRVLVLTRESSNN